ncbi:MAG TPA: hypothetical protein VMZ30_03190 [Pyrinomonadaceae bacterium]|nr:hypothetical protein [Pyrinomonadaceae bacterium]
MSSNHNEPTTVRQYLLGQLADISRDEFEQRFFTDDELVDELLATEDELIEASIAGELSEDEAERFAKYFLITPERQQKLRFRKALQRVAKAEKAEPFSRAEPLPKALLWHAPGWMNWATASVAAIIVLVGIIGTRQPSHSSFTELTLTAGLSQRGGGRVAPTIQLPLADDGLKLHLELPSPLISAKHYRVEIETDNGTSNSLKPATHNGQVIDVVIPASALSRGQYAFNVYAIKTDGTEQRVPGTYFLNVN